MNQSEDDKAGSSRRDWLVAIVLVEFAALLVALLMPITPSKTGSKASLLDIWLEEPTYLDEVIFWFVLSNLLVGVIGLIVWVSRSRD